MHPRPARWLIAAVLVALALGGAALWRWTGLREWAESDRVAAAFEPYRSSWLAVPLSLAVFVVAELLFFPVLVLIFACGVAFGPWLGTLCAFVGALGSAIPPFFLGRLLGREKLERYGGRIVRALERPLAKRGIVAIFVVRKIPAPFTLVNLVCGASRVSFRDFLLGTLLGMGTGILLLTVVAGQLADLVRDPDPARIALALLLLVGPVTIAILLQRALNRRVGEAR